VVSPSNHLLRIEQVLPAILQKAPDASGRLSIPAGVQDERP